MKNEDEMIENLRNKGIRVELVYKAYVPDNFHYVKGLNSNLVMEKEMSLHDAHKVVCNAHWTNKIEAFHTTP